jgi:hypothetical protein
VVGDALGCVDVSPGSAALALIVLADR